MLLIRRVGVNVRGASVRVNVGVRRDICFDSVEARMFVVVVLVVVCVPMLVFFRGMDVLVLVVFRCVQPDAEGQ